MLVFLALSSNSLRIWYKNIWLADGGHAKEDLSRAAAGAGGSFYEVLSFVSGHFLQKAILRDEWKKALATKPSITGK